MSKQPFLTDVATLRKRAREHIDQGAVTPGYGGDTQTAIRVLNEYDYVYQQAADGRVPVWKLRHG